MKNQTYSEFLENNIVKLYENGLFKISNKISNELNSKSKLSNYLIFLYTLVCTSVPLMENALREIEKIKDDTLILIKYQEYIIKHIEEENNHDKWLIEDLRKLGVNPQQIQKIIPSPYIASLTGSQYYWINHFHPISFLGYLFVIERYPPSLDQITSLAKRLEIELDDIYTLKMHSEEDPKHIREICDLVDLVGQNKNNVNYKYFLKGLNINTMNSMQLLRSAAVNFYEQIEQ